MLLLTETITDYGRLGRVERNATRRDATRRAASPVLLSFRAAMVIRNSRRLRYVKKVKQKEEKSDSSAPVKRGVAIRTPGCSRDSRDVDFPAIVFISRLNCEVETSRNGESFRFSFLPFPFAVPPTPISTFLCTTSSEYSQISLTLKKDKRNE